MIPTGRYLLRAPSISIIAELTWQKKGGLPALSSFALAHSRGCRWFQSTDRVFSWVRRSAGPSQVSITIPRMNHVLIRRFVLRRGPGNTQESGVLGAAHGDGPRPGTEHAGRRWVGSTQLEGEARKERRREGTQG